MKNVRKEVQKAPLWKKKDYQSTDEQVSNPFLSSHLYTEDMEDSEDEPIEQISF